MIYCNRSEPAITSKNDYLKWAMESVEFYKQYGYVAGPLVKLDDSAGARHSALLAATEEFVLAHELGHILNGDLEDSKLLCGVNGLEGVFQLVENRNHEREYLADQKAFEIIQRSSPSAKNPIDEQLAVAVVIKLFDVLFLVSQEASLTHPEPIERTARLIRSRYGSNTEDAFLRSYGEDTEDFVNWMKSL